MELQVKVLNINEGKNETIVKRCSLLAQYSAFVGKVREFEKDGYAREESIKKAVVYCRNHDILKELLEKNASDTPNKCARTGEGVIGGNMARCRPKKFPTYNKCKKAARICL